MAITSISRSGHGQIELNRCAFLVDGNIEAQCTAATAIDNGMLVGINEVTKSVKLPAATDVLFGIAYSSEKIYDQFTPGRKNYFTKKDECPRVGFLKTGDRVSTNCLAFDPTDTTTFASEADVWTALVTTTLTSIPVYGKPCSTGEILLSKTSGTYGPKLLVKEATDTADGQKAVKFVVL